MQFHYKIIIIFFTRELDTKRLMHTTKKPATMESLPTMVVTMVAMAFTTGGLIIILVDMDLLDMQGTEPMIGMEVRLMESMLMTTQATETTDLDTPKCTTLPQQLSPLMLPLLTDTLPLYIIKEMVSKVDNFVFHYSEILLRWNVNSDAAEIKILQ